jgi:hypothetical protein
MGFRDAKPGEEPYVEQPTSGKMRDAAPEEAPAITNFTAPDVNAPNWVDRAIEFGGEGEPPVAPPGYISRIVSPRNAVSQKLYDAVASGMHEGFGDSPNVGIEPGGETEKWLQEHGIFQKPGQAPSLRLVTEGLVRPTAGVADLVGRVISSGVGAISSLAGEAAEQSGIANKGMVKEETQGMLEWLMMRGDQASVSRPHIAKDGTVHDIEVGVPPTPDTFRKAAQALSTDGKGSPEVAAKLDHLWDEHGIHPAEVIHDAENNPSVKDALLSSNPEAKPEGYGIEPPKEPEPVEFPGESEKPDASEFGDRAHGADEFPTDELGWDVLDDDVMVELLAKAREQKALANGGGGGGEPPKEGGGLPAANPEGGPLGGLHGRPEPGPSPFREAYDSIMSKMSIGQVDPKKPWSFSQFYTATVDKFHPWLNAVKQAMSPENLKGLATADNPYRLARLFPGWQWVAHGFLNKGVRDFHTSSIISESLSDIMADVKKVPSILAGVHPQDEFRAFLASARARELHNRDIETPFEDDAAMLWGRAAVKKYGDLERRLLEYQNRVAAYARDAGIISRAGYAAMIQANKFYVPFARVIGRAAKVTGAKLAQSFEANNPFFSIEGSEAGVVIDPLETIVKNTYLLTQLSQKNVAAVKMIDLLLQRDAAVASTRTGRALMVAPEIKSTAVLDTASAEHLALEEALRLEDGFGKTLPVEYEDGVLHGRDYDAADASPVADMFEGLLQNAQEGIVSVMRDGRRVQYHVDEELARSMKQLDTTTASWVAKWMSLPAKSLRAGAVLAPDFWFRHSFRDYLYAFTSTAQGVFTPVDMLKGMAAFCVRDENFWRHVGGDAAVNATEGLRGQFWDAMHHGAGGTSFVSIDRAGIQSNLEELAHTTGLFTRSYNVVMDPGSSVWQKTKGLGGMGAAPIRQLYHGAQFLTEMVTSASHIGAYLRDQRLNAVQKEASKALTIPELKGTHMSPREGVPVSEAADKYHAITRNSEAESRALARANATDVEQASLGQLDTKTNRMGFAGRRSAPLPEMEPHTPKMDSPQKRAMIHSAWVARDTAVDAQRIGAMMKGINMINAFANIRIQEADKLVEGLTKYPVAFGMKVAVGVTMPSVLLWSYNHDKSWYQEAPDWQKNTFWLVHVPKWEPATAEQVKTLPPDMVRLINGMLYRDNAVTFRIPKPFTMGVVFGSGPERLLDKWYRDRPEEVKGWLHAIMESTVGDVAPTMLLPMGEQWANRSTLSGGRLVPDRLEHGLPEYQYTDYTNPVAKALGKIVGHVPYIGKTTLASPIVIENYVRQYTGTLGDYAMKLAGSIGTKAGIFKTPDTENKWSDVPFVRAFVVRNPSMGASSIQDFYENTERLKEVQSTYTRLMKDGDIEAAQKIQEAGGADTFIKLDSYQKALTNINTLIHQINGSPKLEPYEKRQQIDALYYQGINIARQGNQFVKMARDAFERGNEK